MAIIHWLRIPQREGESFMSLYHCLPFDEQFQIMSVSLFSKHTKFLTLTILPKEKC